jgi:hypothetical protein
LRDVRNMGFNPDECDHDVDVDDAWMWEDGHDELQEEEEGYR